MTDDQHDQNTFRCKFCGDVHTCTEYTCDKLFYNSDQNLVCTLTGFVHGPLICERRACAGGIGINNLSRPLYTPRVKKCQQIKNRYLTLEFILPIVKCPEIIISPKLDVALTRELMYQIMRLWEVFIFRIKNSSHYMHRRDRQAFVVAILFSLRDGFCCNRADFVVCPHPDFELNTLNKKRRYNEFSVSDIRYGQNLIRRVFNNQSKIGACIDINPYLTESKSKAKLNEP